MNQLIKGAVAGLTATVPMTLTMKELHARLPAHEQYALPPRLITDKIVDEAGATEQLDEKGQRQLAWTAHFGYGAAAGALYAPLAEKIGLPPVTGGVLYGLAVWAGSYLGWLPAAGILRPATEHPPRRTALMIAAHIVWGATTGILVGRNGRSKQK
jgi:uncharacterized membrane protein YagU involved in acid resistance